MPIELTASQALGLWHGVALDQVRHDDRDLTLRQMAILLHIYLVPPPHTVRGLAAELNVTKPVITRALDTMGEMGLVDRVRDDARQAQCRDQADRRRRALSGKARRPGARAGPPPVALRGRTLRGWLSFERNDMTMLDRRLHAYRPDLAESGLQGQVEALRFVDGTPARVAVPVVGLRPKPDLATGIDTELLLGEDVTVFDRADGWCWVKAASDGYVGYIEEQRALRRRSRRPRTSSRCSAPSSIANRNCASPTSPSFRWEAASGSSARRRHAAIAMRCWRTGRPSSPKHVQPIGAGDGGDYVDIATRFLETPYLWGGRSGLGIDCSGLVQLSMLMTGRRAPRDTDMQAATLGDPIDRAELRRGDLVFWKGHVAAMEDPETIVHANGQHHDRRPRELRGCDQADRLALRAADRLSPSDQLTGGCGQAVTPPVQSSKAFDNLSTRMSSISRANDLQSDRHA